MGIKIKSVGTILILGVTIIIFGSIVRGWSQPRKTVPLPTKDITPTSAVSACKRGGCSNQLCLDANAPDMASTCEFKPEYDCYQKAECKLQTDGKCGFTQTTELVNCLGKSK